MFNHKLGIGFSLLMIMATPAIAENVRGVNYDPVHSLEFIQAVGLNDQSGMEKAIQQDLTQLKTLRYRNQNDKDPNQGNLIDINHLRTVFSIFASNAGTAKVNIAKVVNDWNLAHAKEDHYKLSLGVYEFRPHFDACHTENECRVWTQVQVQGVIDAAKTYGSDLIDSIIVDNDGAQLSEADPSYADAVNVRQRIVDDIKTIKKAMEDAGIPPIKIGTAQTIETVKLMFANHAEYQGIVNNVDFVGVNFPLFFYGSKFEDRVTHPNDQYVVENPAKKLLSDAIKNLPKQNKEVVITSEGWPSAGNKSGDAIPNAENAIDYFRYWYHRDYSHAWGHGQDILSDAVVPVSYYVALYDKLPGQVQNDKFKVGSHWGIFSADAASSLLDGNASKPLDKNHVVVNFNNQVGVANAKPSVVTLSACLDDQGQGACYPIYGYSGSGDISAKAIRSFMVDKTPNANYGRIYKSLMVGVYDEDQKIAPYCHINFSRLSQMKDNSTVKLQEKDAEGNCN